MAGSDLLLGVSFTAKGLHSVVCSRRSQGQTVPEVRRAQRSAHGRGSYCLLAFLSHSCVRRPAASCCVRVPAVEHSTWPAWGSPGDRKEGSPAASVPQASSGSGGLVPRVGSASVCQASCVLLSAFPAGGRLCYLNARALLDR
jgi:hypothetical protein